MVCKKNQDNNIEENNIYKYCQENEQNLTKSVDFDYLESNFRKLKLNTSKQFAQAPNWVNLAFNSITQSTGGIEE